MGNMQGGNRKEFKHGQVVTVLQADGRVMEFSRPLRVGDLLNEYPEHFVCHSNALVLLQQGKMLPSNTLLMPGDVYFLLPRPQPQRSVVKHDVAALANGQACGDEKPTGTMKFLITKQQLAKILAEGTIKVAVREPEPVPLQSATETYSSLRPSQSLRVLHRPATTPLKRASSWSPMLESISEVPVM